MNSPDTAVLEYLAGYACCWVVMEYPWWSGCSLHLLESKGHYTGSQCISVYLATIRCATIPVSSVTIPRIHTRRISLSSCPPPTLQAEPCHSASGWLVSSRLASLHQSLPSPVGHSPPMHRSWISSQHPHPLPLLPN